MRPSPVPWWLMRAFLTLVVLLFALSFLFAASSRSASVYAPSDVVYSGNNTSCWGWTAYQSTKSTDYSLKDDLGYARKCHNITYISYCNSASNFIDFNVSRTYWAIDCTGSDYCTGWTRFYIEKTSNFTERDQATNLSRACMASTYVAWCVKSRSIVDYTVGHRYSELNCSDWQQTCGFTRGSDKKRQEADRSGYCRNCVDTSYRYYCNTSGRISFGPSQVQSICGNWTACPVSNYSSSTKSGSPGGSSLDISDPSVVTTIVLAGVVFTVILLIIFGRHKD